MPTVAMVEYDQASPAVRAIYDDIMATKGIDFVPNFCGRPSPHIRRCSTRSGAA